MATQEKLMKSLEILKKLSISNSNSDAVNIKKDKIHHCHVITECISSHAIATASTIFPSLLNYTMESLFHLCNDSDSDIRMVAEESLNRIIRALNDENITRVLIELHKEIKKNNSARSLRSALSRFSKLAHSIRPNKGKVYVINLFPSLMRIIGRPEESIHETLANSLPKIIEVLGPFTTDNDIKNLLKSLMANISNPSAVIKRTAANSIQSICLNCPKPYVSIVYCIHIVLGFVFPLNENCDTHLIFGVMGVLKTLLPHWRKYLRENNQMHDREKHGTDWVELKTEKLLQIYELCLHYVNNKDHNLVNSSLETLNILFQNSTKELKEALLNPAGLSKSNMQIFVPTKRKSLSLLSITSDSTLISESELTDSLRPDINKWIDQSKLTLSSLNIVEKSKESFEKSQSLESSSSTITRSLSQIDLESSIEFDAIKTRTSSSSTDLLERTANSTDKSSSNEDIPDCKTKDIDIGQFKDQDVPLKYCGRLLTSSFLLTGVPTNLINDKACRVSVKASAFSCLSSIIRLYPQLLLKHLDRTVHVPQKDIDQRISDILLYSKHHDPQLRGNARILVAHYLVSVILQSRGYYNDWLVEHSEEGGSTDLKFEELMKMFNAGLNDDSSLCIRHTLQSLELSLKYILESKQCHEVIPILLKLPDLFSNPYWLVKVNLCDLMCHLPYITIHYVTGDNKFQSKIMLGLQQLLKDSDVRVRNVSSNTLARLVSQFYFESPHENVVTTKAISYRKAILSNLYKKSWLFPFNYKLILENMPFPFNRIDKTPSEDIEFSLSKVLHEIKQMVLFPNNKYIIGCIEALAVLSQQFPCTEYKRAWNCYFPKHTRQENQTNDLLELCIDIMTDSTMVYDIGFHTNLLMLCSNLYAGFSICVLRAVPVEDLSKKWNMFESSVHSNISDVFLKHIMKILSIYQHIIDGIHLPSQQKPAILSLPTASPMKRRKSDLEKKSINTKISEEKTEKKEKEKNLVGNFSYSTHYIKIYEALKTAYGNYRTSLEPAASEKILNMLKESLRSLSILMEIGTLSEFGIIAEEILNYLNSIFRIEPSGTVECVQQLLKSIFETNLLVNGIDIVQDHKKMEKNEIDSSGFYYHLFLKPYNEVSLCINALKDINKKEGDGDRAIMGYLHRNAKRKATVPAKLDKVLANYIRIFEPMVIRSLKQYTITSDVELQGGVLQLLSQLVQLKINYCLLDADQIFINFVINQFNHIEEGQIRHSEKLIPRIFQFLVQLSYSKQHSKSIIDIPKIIQLCDGLTASGQSPLTNCIPALTPIVKDIFLTRNILNSLDSTELETTREVVLAMLLKLIEYNDILELITLILDDSKYCSDTDKWLRWSKSVFNSFLVVLKGNKYKLDTVDSFDSVRKLIFALHPNAFRPIDDIIILLFQEPPSLHQDISYFTRWMGRILTVLIILSPMKEEVILSKISSLKNTFMPSSVFENIVITPDPLNVTNSADFFQNLNPEKILILFIFRTLSLATKKCSLLIEEDNDEFFVEELSIFIMLCLHNFQSGFLCKTANIAISIIEKTKDVEECDAINIQIINENFQNLIFFYPTLTFHWCYFLSLLSYEDLSFWSCILQLPEEDSEKMKNTSNSINTEVVKVGGSIVFCDYLCENSSKRTDILDWVLKNNVNLLINLDQEAPINEFFSFIHRDSKLSRMLLKYVDQLENLSDFNLIYKLKVLKAVENTHPNLTGQLIKLLLSKFIYVNDLAVTKEVSKLATRKVELLLTMSSESIHNQLSREDLLGIINNLSRKEFHMKHETLLGLLGKLGDRFYDLNLPFMAQKRIMDPKVIKHLDINKEWYLSQVKLKLNNVKMGREVAKMLSILSYTEQMELFENDRFDGHLLKFCLDCGVDIHQYSSLGEVPDILKASIHHLCREVERILKIFPEPFQSWEFSSLLQNKSLPKHGHNLNSGLKASEFSKVLNYLIPSILSYLQAIPSIPLLEINEENISNFIKLSIISLKFINYFIESKNIFDNMLTNTTLACFNYILKQDKFFTFFNSKNHTTWSCSAISDVYRIKTFLTEDAEYSVQSCAVIPKDFISRFEDPKIGQSCSDLYSLLYWMYTTRKQSINIPDCLVTDLMSIINSLGRISLFNSCMFVPVKAWDRGLDFSSFSFQNPVISIPVELLQDQEILEEYLFRITLLGWNSRQQFEETWMCLLSVLCNSPSDENDTEESNEIYRTASSAIKGITSMLIQTLYYPIPGKKNHSEILTVSRDEPIICDKISLKKLKDIQLCIRNKYNKSPYFCGNKVPLVMPFDDLELEDHYFCFSGRMSIKYFLISLGILEVNDKHSANKILKKRDEILEKSGLDITSCLHFLQDFFTQLLQYQKISSLALLHESVISILVLSDLFNDKSQFSWMLDLFLELLKIHAVEDELLHMYLIVGICKSAAILNPELEVYETIKKYLTNFLKSNFVPSKTACLHGLLFILEGCRLSNISIGRISDELQLILPCAVDYIQSNLCIPNNELPQSQEHTLLMWTVAFYIVENVDELHLGPSFVDDVVTQAIYILSNQKRSIVEYKFLMQKFQRLITTKKNILEKFGKKVVKLAMDGLKNSNSFVAITSIQLLFSYMYIEYAEHIESSHREISPENLVQTVEKFSALFEYIKRGYIFEAEIVCSLLPQVLDDFFTPADILTKVIGEFLSAQQPHQKLLSKVVFHLFQSAVRQNQLTLLQDWIVFSLPNFTQNFSYPMATWCLTCFFISASRNQWLTALFPYIQTRMQRYDYEDREVLCVAGSDFYKNLSTDKQKETFKANFKMVKNLPEMPFNDLLSSL